MSEWRSMDTAPSEVTIERPVLFLARSSSSPFDVKAPPYQRWMPVVGYGSEGRGWRAAVGYMAYGAEVVGRLPRDFVGLVLGDWITHKRIRRWAQLQAETREHLARWGAKEPFEEVSPSIAVPLIEAAVDEDRDGLKEMWARLLASAMHTERKGRVRRSLIDLVKQMDPLDALAFRELSERTDWPPGDWQGIFYKRLNCSNEEGEVSIMKLQELKLIAIIGVLPKVTPLGAVLKSALAD